MLYIMRHGKTDWNAARKLQGRTDIPLNEEGRKMAEEVRRECEEIGFDICFSSPLVRARETAKTYDYEYLTKQMVEVIKYIENAQ